MIAADTIVVQGNEILGKPDNASDARFILRRLRGRSHEVVTAIAVMGENGTMVHEDACTTQVQVGEFSDHLLESYIATGDSLDKAGAYGIQNRRFNLAAPVDGCLANVIGLPLCHLARTLRKLNVHPPVDVPQVCQTHIEYDCPVYERILSE
jgi:MAF protein